MGFSINCQGRRGWKQIHECDAIGLLGGTEDTGRLPESPRDRMPIEGDYGRPVAL
jgi:hypothetical protein